MAFEIGDVVQLKSGGPKMTVTDVSADEVKTVSVIWFCTNESEKFTAASFYQSSLKLVTENTRPAGKAR